MSKFSARVAVHGDEGTTWFNPGDEVPEWAAELVGAHCITKDAEDAPEDEAPDFTGSDSEQSKHDGDDDGDDGDDDGDSDDESKSDSDTPDFTAPAPARRGRPRKNS